MMATASTYRLGDGCTIQHGYAFSEMQESEDETLPIVVNIGNFRYKGGFRFTSTRIQRYEGDFPERFRLSPGDVLVVMTCQTAGGEILGVPGRIPSDGRVFLHNQRLGKIVVTRPDELDLGYLYYLFLSPALNAHLAATATGAKIQHTAPERIEDFRWRRPALAVQRRIAEVLSAYDDLMESNARRIKILEEVARSLYREWFIEFRLPGQRPGAAAKLPAGWRSGVLGDFVDEVRDAVDPRELSPTTPYFGLEHLPRRSTTLFDWGVASEVKSTKLVVKKGDVLFGKIRPYFHKVGLAPLDAVCSADAIVLRPKDDEVRALALACASSDDLVARATAASQGTKMPRANWDVMRKYPLPMPPPELLAHFNGVAGGAAEMAATLGLKNRALAAARDLLLPRLVSGEIELPT